VVLTKHLLFITTNCELAKNTLKAGKIKTCITTVIAMLLVLLVCFLVPFYITGWKLPWGYDNKTALIGDSMGGTLGPIIGFIGVILTFLAFYIQYDANKVQREALFTEQFESKFFELLRLHRENVDRIKYRSDQGLYALKEMSLELLECCKRIRKCDDKLLLTDKGAATIGFHYFYSGVNLLSKKHIEDLMNPDDDEDWRILLRKIKTSLDTWVTDEGSSVIVDQESRLEIYFNHILHVMSFLHKQTDKLREEEKIFFVETFTSQLTSREITLLLHYALSEKEDKWIKPNNYVKEFGLIEKAKEGQLGVKIETINELI